MADVNVATAKKVYKARTAKGSAKLSWVEVNDKFGCKGPQSWYLFHVGEHALGKSPKLANTPDAIQKARDAGEPVTRIAARTGLTPGAVKTILNGGTVRTGKSAAKKSSAKKSSKSKSSAKSSTKATSKGKRRGRRRGKAKATAANPSTKA